MDIAYRKDATDRRLGLLLTLLVHAALIVGWQAVRTMPAPAPQDAEARSRVLWIPLPSHPPAARERPPAQPPKEAVARPHARPAPTIAVPQAHPAAPAPAPAAASPAAADSAVPSRQDTPKPTAAQILERARREAGAIAKALRKENNPYIAAPLDSPQIRLRQGIEHARAMAPTRIWEAPKVEELVNNTGDGARRTRVISGNGSYCVTERATNTDVEMIEHHGKLRITNCPEHEEPSKQQEWRTLRD